MNRFVNRIADRFADSNKAVAIKRKRPLLLAFCIPAAVMLAALVYRGVYPFGDRCFLRVDLYNQYMPFFTEFHRKLREGESLFFSWRAGLGANFLALYAYYLASPVNFLLVFCPEEWIMEFMTALIVIKISLCGLTFAWYLKRHFGTDSYAVTLFSAGYALSGFMAAYNWNIMWLDCIYLAPVVIFGLEELVGKKRPFLYTISLGICILTNYYISIMICIFLVLYFCILALPLSLREKGRSLKRFLLYSLLAGGLSGAVLLPGIVALRATRFDQADFPKRIKCYFPVWEAAARHCMNVSTEIRNDHWPNLYCGVAVLVLLPLYVCCRQIRWREKMTRLLLLIFFHLSFSVNLLDFLWHGLNFPDNLPARQSFLYIFLVLTMCFEAVLHLRDGTRHKIVLSAGCGLLFLAVCARLGGGEVTRINLLFTALYVVVYGLLLCWYHRGRARGLVWVFLFCAVIMETAANTIETSVFTTSRSDYREEIRTDQTLLSAAEKGNGLIRTEKQGRMTKNDGMLGGFSTATLFSSTVSENMSHFYRRLGMSSSKVFYCYDGATPLVSALLGVRYTLSESPDMADHYHRLLKETEGGCLYENQPALPVGYVVDLELVRNWDMEEGNPIAVQNHLAEAMGIRDPLYEEIPVFYKEGEAVLEPERGGYLCVYPKACSTKDIAADINGYERIYGRVYYPYLLQIGWCDGGSRISLSQSGARRNEKNELELSAYRLNQSVLEEMITYLRRYPMEVTRITDTGLSGRVELEQDGLLVTAISGEAGWKATVDGKPVPTTLFGGALLGVELPAGTHMVSFSYTPPGASGGVAMSLCSIGLLVMLWRKAVRAGRNKKC